MKLEKIKYLLLAQQMDRAVAFYQGVFALQPTELGHGWSELSFGNCIIALHGGGDGTAHPSDLSLQVDNIVAACRIIREHGGKILNEPHRREGEPIVMAIFRDPEGNEVMLTQAVS
jgi:predicted enzyme related to lactoylglutathione lyase